jgi:hypothetical protein
MGAIGVGGASNSIIETVQPNAYWSGTDLSLIFQTGTTPVTANGQTVTSWDDSIGGVVITTQDDPPEYAGGLGLEFDQASDTGGMRDNGAGNVSRFNYLHDGSGGSVYFRFEVTNWTASPTSIVILAGTQRFAGGQRGFAVQYWASSTGQARVLVSNGSATFQAPFVTVGSGLVNLVVNVSATGVSYSVNGGAFGAESVFGAFVPDSGDASFGLTLGADPISVLAPGGIIVREFAVRDSVATAADVAAFVDYAPSPAL